MAARKPRARYQFKDGKSRFNDIPLDGIVVVHVKGDTYKVEDPKVLRQRGIPKSASPFTYALQHRKIFMDGPL